MLWPKSLKRKIKTKITLAPLTSFKIGGPAQYFFEPTNLKSLQAALVFARRSKQPVWILGGGTNILVADAGVKGLVVRLSHKYFKRCFSAGSFLIAGSGLKLNTLIAYARKNCLSGLEFLTGIPGSLGGSLLGNAGAWGKSIGELVEEVTVLDYNGKLKRLAAKQLKFTYRKSNLSKFIILQAKLKLRPEDQTLITAKLSDYHRQRQQSQGDSLPNAGCIFKNPSRSSAGRLIDLCGLKGKQQGQALISKRHANFILNAAGAKCWDVLALMGLMQKEVKKKFKINLRPEIKIWK